MTIVFFQAFGRMTLLRGMSHGPFFRNPIRKEQNINVLSKNQSCFIGTFVLAGLIVDYVAAYSINRLSITNGNSTSLATNWKSSIKTANHLTNKLVSLLVVFRDHILVFGEAETADAKDRVGTNVATFPDYADGIIARPDSKIRFHTLQRMFADAETMGTVTA